MTQQATPNLANLFASHTNSYELDIFWAGGDLTILVLRVNGQQLTTDDVRSPPVARFNVPAPTGGMFVVEAAIAAGTATLSQIVVGIKDDATNSQRQVDTQASLQPTDKIWFVSKTVNAP